MGYCVFFFSSRRRHTRCSRDWSSECALPICMVPAERAKALGWLSAATSAGVIVGPAIGSFMHRFGDAAPGVFAAALVLVNVAFAWKWLPESRWARGGAPTVGAPRPSQALGKAVRNIVQPAARVLREPGEAISLFIWIYALAR